MSGDGWSDDARLSDIERSICLPGLRQARRRRAARPQSGKSEDIHGQLHMRYTDIPTQRAVDGWPN